MPTVPKFFAEFLVSARADDRPEISGQQNVGRSDGSALGALADSRRELLDVIEHLSALGHLTADLLFRVHDGGVVAAERLPDLG